MATDKNKHLDCVLSSHRTSNEPKLLDKHMEKRDKIKKSLEDKYGPNLYELFNSGSYAKNTAINKKFDFDLMAPFKRKSFDTLKKMYDDVFDFLYEKYKSEATVKKQKVSTGLKFNPDEDDHIINIDVVPGRELNDKQYESDKTLNLYVYEQFGKISGGSERIKSNVRAQM